MAKYKQYQASLVIEGYFITLRAQDKNLKPQERFWEAFLITLPTLTHYFVGAQSNGLTYNF